MKKLLALITASLLILSVEAQVYTMCTDISTTDTSGTIFDSGGPGGNYGNNENCGFVINPGCASSITLTFAFINIESCCDDINIYDGVDNTGTLLLNAQGTSTPAPVTANSGTMFIEFQSDGSVTPAGFEAAWSSVIAGQSPVVAGFNISNTTPAYQENVIFTDNSTSSPNQWFWDFGDGNTSTEQNPNHSYFTSGNQNVTLIASNCTFSDTITQTLNVQPPPFSTSVDTIKMTVACDGNIATQTVTFNNAGATPLGYEIQSDLPLDTVLNRVNRFNSNLTALVPSLHIITDGVVGNNINDGGGDMYDGGNRINTNISGTSNIDYSDNLVTASTDFGPNGQYFTRMNPGLFVMAADLDNVSLINITGNLGADGSGNSDGTILTSNRYGSTFRAFINRTFNAGDPSINRMIIVQDNPTAAHTFLTTTGDEDHEVTNLNSSKRVYYLLFAAQGGLYLDDNQMQLIMDEFLSWLETIPSYIALSPLSDTIPATGTSNLTFSFDATGLVAGTYTNRYTIKNTTPPFATYYLYSEVEVFGNPNLNILDSCLSYDSLLLNDTKFDTLVYENLGCADLVLNSVTSNNPAFSVISYDTTLLPGEVSEIIVTFNPTILGVINGDLLITTNSNDTSICLNGISTLPQVIARVEPNPLVINLDCGDSITEIVTVYSDGNNNLNLTGGIIGGAGISDSSIIQWTTTGETTIHNFNINNNGIDTLFITVGVNGDYDQVTENAEIVVEGNNLGQVGNLNVLGQWDSVTVFITDPLLTTVLADGLLEVSVVNSSAVNPGVGGTDENRVRIFTKGQKWLSGNIPSTLIASGDSIQIPVTFTSAGINAGSYTTSIEIKSNDPVNPSYYLPVQFTVTGVANYIMSDTCIDLGILPPGDATIDTLFYTNIGCDELVINTVTSSNGDFTIISFDNNIAVGNTGYVIVEFSPSSVGTINGTLAFTTNVQDTTMCITGRGTNITSQFDISTQDACTAEFSFTNNTIGSSNSWFWDFGDGATSTDENPNHLYGATGNYTVTFVACNPLGCDTTTQNVNAAFTLDYAINTSGTLEVGENISFDLTGNAIISASWNFGDGSAAPGLSTSHTYTNDDTYIVQVDIVTNGPCFITLYDTLTIGGVSINDLSDKNVSIYPNPSNGLINISLENTKENIDLDILNSIGQKVYTKTNINNIGEQIILEEKDGIYLIRLSSDGIPIYEKAIILNK